LKIVYAWDNIKPSRAIRVIRHSHLKIPGGPKMDTAALS